VYHSSTVSDDLYVYSIVEHVTSETTMKEGVDVSVQPDKSLTEMEKELLEKFQVRVF